SVRTDHKGEYAAQRPHMQSIHGKFTAFMRCRHAGIIPHMAAESLYDRIQRRLDRLGLKAEAASVRAGMGRDGIRNIKRGKSASPRGRNLKALAEVLECSIEHLLGAEPRPPRGTAAEPPRNAVAMLPGYVAVPTIVPPAATGGFPGPDALLGPPKYFEEE